MRQHLKAYACGYAQGYSRCSWPQTVKASRGPSLTKPLEFRRIMGGLGNIDRPDPADLAKHKSAPDALDL
jgi:hypothetical protein